MRVESEELELPNSVRNMSLDNGDACMYYEWICCLEVCCR